MKTNPYLLALLPLAAMLTLSSCSEDESAERFSASSRPISFSVEKNDATRAVNEVSGISSLQTASFGVFASYTGATKYMSSSVTSNFMYNQQVTWNASQWTYSPQRYWPADTTHYVSFFAYAPYESAPNETKCIADMSGIDAEGDAWLLYQLSQNEASQVDLLYGVDNTTGMAMTDRRYPVENTRLTFCFRHALACVGDVIGLQCSEALKTLLEADAIHLYISSVDITLRNLTAKARFYLNPARIGGQWESVASGTQVVERTLSSISITALDGDGTYASGEYINKSVSSNILSTGHGLYYIPVHYGSRPQEALITVNFVGIHSDGTAKAGYVYNVYTLQENPQKKEQLNIVLGPNVYEQVK